MQLKTLSILGAAAALILTSVLLESSPRAATNSPAISTIAVNPESTCGSTAAPSQGSQSFGYGTFQGNLSQSMLLQNGSGEVFVNLDLSADKIVAEKRQPLRLAIVIDRSGSMSGDKIQQVRDAASGIVSRLGSEDQASLVAYDSLANVLVPMTNMNEFGKSRLRDAIAALEVGGSTNLHGGMTLGRDEILKQSLSGSINRVILLSDGQANVGISDTPALSAISKAAADKGVRLTTVGVGTDYNEDLMEALAEQGRGQYYYVRDGADLQNVFTGELQNLAATVATSVELQLTPACAGVEILEVYGYASEKKGGSTVVPMADLFGGDKRNILVKLRVPVKNIGKSSLIAATLSFTDAQKNTSQKVAMALGVEVSQDSKAVEASVNKDVMAQIIKVESAVQLRSAVDAYGRGDVSGATKILQEAKAGAMKKAESYALPAAAVAPSLGEFDKANDTVQSADPFSERGKDIVKATKSSARQMSK